MTALGWLLLTLMAAALTASLAFNWWQSRQLDQLHGTHASSRPRSVFPAARPGTTLLSPAEAAAHADAMHEISGRYIPVAQAPGSAPWETPEGAAAEELQQQRFAYARNELERVRTDPTTGAMRAILAGMPERVYGQAPQLAIEAAGQERVIA